MEQSLKPGHGRYVRVRQTLIVLVSTFILGTAALAFYVFQLETDFVEAIALEDAESFSKALTEFRTLYTSEVVERVRGQGIQVTHDYLEQTGAIPLPVTLSMLLGQRLDVGSTSKVRLYSKHPFPWRKSTGGPHDQFERDALAHLETHPQQPFYRFEEGVEQTRLRFATADLMRKSCVDCHNSHPESPKVDWKEGDVRGVLSVSLPLRPGSARALRGFRGMLTLLVASAVLGLILISFFAVRLRRGAIEVEQLALRTQQVNLSLENEITQREHAETQRRSMEAQVRHTQKLETVGLLAGGIAHDLNNLLQGMLGNASQAKHKLGDTEEALKHIELVELIARRAAMLMDQLLTYAGRTPVVKKPVDLSELVTNLKPLLSTAVSGRGQLNYKLAKTLPAVEADVSQIEQMVMNLVTNAADALVDRNGNITIRTGIIELPSPPLPNSLVSLDLPSRQYAYVDVVDEGSGITADMASKMFDPFFTTRRSGRGLGLATLRGSVHAHGGGVAVASKLTVGTTIRIALPCSEQENPALVDGPATSVPIEDALTVLVIDDDPHVRQVARMLLEESHFKVLEASDGTEGIAIFESSEGPIEVVILDFNMPNLSGEETFHGLRGIRDDVRVVISSGFIGDKAIGRMASSPGVKLLRKPYTLEQLLAAVEDTN